MPRFRVTATAADGSRVTTLREAASAELVTSLLQREGFTIEAIEATPEQELPSTGRLSHQEARDFAEQISGMAQTGLPLHEGLRALQAEVPPGTFRRVIGEVATRLERGEPLEDALQEVGGRLPGHLRGLILAGVRSGRIDAVLGEFVSYSQVGVSLRRALWLSLSYPFMMIVAYVVIFSFLSAVVVRGFEAIFKDFGIDLPAMTILLLKASNSVASVGVGAVVGPIVACGMILVAGRILLDPASRSHLMARLPLFGPLWRWAALAEFSHYLGLLLECGTPMSSAVTLAADGAHDAGLTQACEAVAQEITAGHSLAESVAWWRVFPAGFTKMLRWAEGHQSLPETLHMTGEMFEARARAHAAFIGSVCGIVSVIVILWGCAFVVIALFLPLYQLISRLAG